ncbi:MAG: acetate--CoA ligase, partial [Rhizorhabdus sp.]|nr:acetate--CoA ligase [Rhizorhabdus sp.]
MTDIFPGPAAWAARAKVTKESYAAQYDRSLNDAHAFWLEQAQRLDWIEAPTLTNESSFLEADFGVKWFADGVLNVSANCIDRHLPARADDIAIIWEPDVPTEEPRRFTFAQVHEEVCRFANVLKGQGVKKGDRVTIYLPMIPEAAFALLACTRIGAIHSIVFGGFSPEALAGRIQDCDSRLVITSDAGMRGGKQVPLTATVDAARVNGPCVEAVL